jgi:hypothetical protein
MGTRFALTFGTSFLCVDAGKGSSLLAPSSSSKGRFAITRLITMHITVQPLRVVFIHAQTTIKCCYDCYWANPLTAWGSCNAQNNAGAGALRSDK